MSGSGAAPAKHAIGPAVCPHLSLSADPYGIPLVACHGRMRDRSRRFWRSWAFPCGVVRKQLPQSGPRIRLLSRVNRQQAAPALTKLPQAAASGKWPTGHHPLELKTVPARRRSPRWRTFPPGKNSRSSLPGANGLQFDGRIRHSRSVWLSSIVSESSDVSTPILCAAACCPPACLPRRMRREEESARRLSRS